MKWKGQEYTAQSGGFDLEAMRKSIIPKCKQCGSEENLGSVQRKCIVAVLGVRNVETGYAHDHWLCDKCASIEESKNDQRRT